MSAKRGRFPAEPVVVLDDEAFVQQSIEASLSSHGINHIVLCGSAEELFESVTRAGGASALLLDLMIPGLSGLELVTRVRERYPDIPIIVVTGAADIHLAVECMKLGVFDFLTKAIDETRLVSSVKRATEWRELADENVRLRTRLFDRQIRNSAALAGVVYRDQRMHSVFLYAESVARSSQTILITGETGVGKEVVARAVHRMSGKEGEFVPVNVAGYDDAMFADALFGHTAGAYTGAQAKRTGLVGQARGGTLLLDEIGELTPPSQVKLLRLLENREYYPLGSDALRRSDARVIVSTNRDLEAEMENGAFRKDLYYRLQTHHIAIPPLRERPDDILPLARHYLEEAGREYGKELSGFTEDALEIVESLPFPGNVRELRALLFDAASRDRDGKIDVDDLPERAEDTKSSTARLSGRQSDAKDDSGAAGLSLSGGDFPTLQAASARLIELALERTGGNQAEAARLLGISPPALSRRLRRSREE